MIRRHQDWPVVLPKALRELWGTPFAWGSHDCALAACTVIEAMTGHDPAAELRGTYDSETGALRAISRAGAEGLEDLAVRLANECGFPPVAVLMAQRGDLVLIPTSEGPALGIVDMDGIHAVFPSEKNAVRRPLRQCGRAWRIP
jgi:hypothetical protein